MNLAIFILADGFPAPLIFFGFVALIFVLSGLFGKSSAKPTPRVPLGGSQAEAGRVRAELQRRAGALLENVARGGARPPTLPQQPKASRGRQANANRKTTARVAASAAPTLRPVPARQAIAEPVAPVVNRRGQSEIGRNLKLLLQRGGVREAVLLGEVLGTPKSLRDDA